jgi:ubiquitin-conjugating enzyme E2 D/E
MYSVMINWSRELTFICTFFFANICLDDPLVASIAHQYLNDREEHDRIAKDWAKRYVV